MNALMIKKIKVANFSKTKTSHGVAKNALNAKTAKKKVTVGCNAKKLVEDANSLDSHPSAKPKMANANYAMLPNAKNVAKGDKLLSPGTNFSAKNALNAA